MVEVEVIVVVHVRLDGVEIDVDVFKLPHQIEARCHALSARDSIAFVCRGPHQLEALLGNL